MPVRGNPMFGYPSNDRAEYFLQAIANAKQAGAAAWCFHAGSDADDFRTGPPSRIIATIRAMRIKRIAVPIPSRC